MLLKIICIIFIINTFSLLCDAIPISEYNETAVLVSINSQLSELRAVQERHEKLIDGLVKAVDVQNRQEKFLNDLLKAADIQSLRADIQSIKAEQERLKKDLLENESVKNNFRYLANSCTGAKTSGIYDILIPNYSSKPVEVACDTKTQGGGWTIILRRMDGSVDFYRNWTEYQRGFGDLSGEFFLGLDKIHALTADGKQELLVVLEDFDGVEKFEAYDSFAIGDEDQLYVLHTLGEANGTAGDSLNYHRGERFSTFDRDNDESLENCAEYRTGAWWYADCHFSNLAGRYNDNSDHKGVNWYHFRGHEYSLRKAVMMIRPRK
ncbi:ficolin-1-like [Drosophila innubila]|uniref:ficolin-1-like n=1 Tax=Drosophila innubila TaxID=198719 RepID=UPI00148BF2F6|nr:ficolin-1-like [Drosophila innubila]